MLKSIHAPRAAMLSRVLVWALTLAAPAGALIYPTFTLADPPPQAVNINIPAGDLDSALQALAKQTGTDIVFRPELVKGLKTSGVSGQLSARQAVEALLKGTALAVRADGGGSMIIVPGSSAVASAGVLSFNIPAGQLGAALKTFSDQAHLTLKYSRALIRGRSTQGLSGSYAAADALRMLLTGTGIAATAINASSYVLKALPKAKSAAVGPSPEGTEHVLVAAPQEKPFSGMNVDIPRTIDDVQPYIIFDSETIEQSGATNIGDFLKERLTMNTVAQTSSQVIAPGQNATGSSLISNISSINLRGLGTNETLILVDGRRMAGVNISLSTSGGSAAGQPDVNGIPLAAIDRIEILPSSASGIYGGSALGGVVNIILKRNYTGGDLRVTYDRPTSGNAPITTISSSYGTGFEDGKSHLMLNAQYSDSEPLTVGDRVDLIDRGYETLLENDPGFVGYGPLSTAPNPLLGATPNIIAYNPNTGLATNLTLKSTGQSLNCPTATLPAGYSATSNPSTIIPCKWNLAFPNVNQQPTGLQTPLGSNPKVLSLSGNFSRQMSEKIEFFTDVFVSSNKSFQDVNQVSSQFVPPTSPYNPFNQTLEITFPDNFTTPYTSTSTTTAVTAGFKVDLPRRWQGEMDYTWSKNTFATISYATASAQAFTDGTLDPFVDTLAHPLNLSPYVTTQPFSGSSTVNDIALRGAGPIGSLPWGDPQLAFGLEHRLENEPESVLPYTEPSNPAFTYEEITDYFAQAQTVDSLYAEATVPLVTSRNALPGISSVDLQLADRIERYSVNAGSTEESFFPNMPSYLSPPYYYITPTPPNANSNGAGGTPLSGRTSYSSNNQTVGLKYKPVDDVIIRASHATAFLPPTPSQLLVDPVVNINGDTITDPKTGTTYQVNTISGGNAGLKPQTAKNWDLGLIYEPQEPVLKGLRVNFEYYQIEQFGYITSLNGDQILSDPALANRVTRNPTTGLITLINESDVNATEFKTEGFDLALDYQKPTSIGTFYLHAAATRLEHNLQQYTVGGTTYELAGAPLADIGGGGAGAAKWKGNATLNWGYRNWNLGWTVTVYGRYPQAGYPDDPFGSYPTYVTAQGSDYIPSQVYHDFFASYTFDSTSGSARASFGSAVGNAITKNLTVQLGIKNVFNTLPPFDAYFQPFYVSPYGDLRLRDIWLTVKKAF